MKQLSVLLLSVSMAASGSANDSLRSRDSSITKTSHPKMTVAEVLKKYTDDWMEIPGVVGTGEGKSGGKACIMVFVERKSERITKQIPTRAGGYKVVIKETGKIEAR